LAPQVQLLPWRDVGYAASGGSEETSKDSNNSFTSQVQEDVIMKRIVWMVALFLALPVAAFANSVDFANLGGSLTGSSAGLILTGSMLQSVSGFGGGGTIQGDLGSVTFNTGALTGSTANSETFAAGGSFVITGNGTDGLPNGVIFNGSFNGPVTLTLIGTDSAGNHIYSVQGSVKGKWVNGSTVSGATVQITVNTGKGFFNGSSVMTSGDTIITTAPEPGTLALLGTGLVGLAGALHRKHKA
jgi:hypothetical protein